MSRLPDRFDERCPCKRTAPKEAQNAEKRVRPTRNTKPKKRRNTQKGNGWPKKKKTAICQQRG